MLIGLIAMVSVSVVDTFFVGQLGTDPLAAMGFSFPVMFFMTGIASGLGTALQSGVSRTVGDDSTDDANRLTTHALLLAVTVAVVLIGLGLTFMEPLFRLLGADATTMPLIESYMTIWFANLFFFVIPWVGGAALMGHGDAKTPMYFMVGASLVNALLDPLLIFGLGPVPALELPGAALASAISRGMATGATLWVLVRKDYLLSVGDDFFANIGTSWWEQLRIAAPAAGTNIIIPVTTAILTRLTANYGKPAVAAYGAGTRIQALATLVFNAIAIGLVPVIGQNWGADLTDRVVSALKLSERTAIAWGAASWGLLFAASPWIASTMVEGAETIDALVLFLTIVPIGYAGTGVFIVGVSSLNALDYPVHAAALSITRSFFLTAPLAWIGSYFFGLAGIFGSIVVGNAVVAIGAAVTVRHVIRTA